MEALIIVTILLIFWTQQVLWGNAPPEPEQSKEAKLAEALQKYLESGIEVQTRASKKK
jgi:hypothetical protein